MSRRRNNEERMPKKDYFEMRLKDAEENGNESKAEYYRSRLEQLKEETVERISLTPAGLFGDRDTIEEAFEYAEMMSKSTESPIHAITPVYVLYNTIAKQYDLVPKQNN